jgi:beta-galactosidase
MDLIKFNGLLHGGDYNPDQWLDYPDILEKDIAYMKEAKVNCVTLGVFSWARLEPEEGVYQFDWLQKVMDRLYENGIYTILATPTGAMPHWLTEKYEEVTKVNENGLRRLHGQRHNFCPSSPVMREKMQAIDEALAKQFGHHKGLLAWHISNEYGGDNDGIGCHCPYCENAFRKWLQNRYQTLDNVNHAWWTYFWSNIYTDWEQIHTPSEIGEHTMHGVKLDYNRFMSNQILDFAKAEIAAVKKYSDRPSLTNLMGAYKPLDYFKWAKAFDLVSFDNYPWWHAEDMKKSALQAAFMHALTRSLKKQPYLLMESTPSIVNWAPRNTLKRPGMHALSSLQAIAYGADSVQYFQWRKSRGGFEKFHGAVIDHKNGDNTRVFRDVAELGARLEAISEEVLSTCNRPKAAFVFDWENFWAIEDAAAILHISYLERIAAYFQGLCEAGIDVDIVDMDDTLEGYELVIAPLNYMYRGDYIENVKRFVAQGGTYVTTYWSGEVDDSDLCFLEEHPLREVLGIRTEEIDVRPLDAPTPNHVLYKDGAYEIKDLCAIVHAETADVLATYESDFYQGYPALTRNSYRKGQAYFIAAEAEYPFVKALYEDVLREKNLTCELSQNIPDNVLITRRSSADESKVLWFVMNFNPTQVTMNVESTCVDIETAQEASGEIVLEGYQCRILKEK